MRAPRPRSIASGRLACALGLAFVLVVSGCATGGDDRAFIPGDPAREGIAAELDGVDYEVFITRELNVRDPEDKQYFPGPPAPPGSGYYGVFVRACALDDMRRETTTSGRIKAVDIRGKEYRPIPLKPDNVFAYREQALRPGECLPNEASATSFGPTGGAMILFRIPFSDTENRPFELEIEGEPPAAGRPPRIARFELDL
jgi:hypothetical protein